MAPARRISPPIITLTSDFGPRDSYVAEMKGVVLSICPGATLIDISHDVPAHDILHGAFVLATATRHFPPKAIHVAVVDPGVGTARKPLLLQTPGGTYLAPDNGLLTYVLMTNGLPGRPDSPTAADGDAVNEPSPVGVPERCTAYVLNRERYWLAPVSNTFHGRDIFAPAAAHLAAGVSPGELGDAEGQVMGLAVPEPVEQDRVIHGRVIHVDIFGNLVSNIQMVEAEAEDVSVEIGGRVIRRLSRSYAAAGGLLAIIGSHGYLEVALTGGSAAEHLGGRVGTGLRVWGFNRPRRT